MDTENDGALAEVPKEPELKLVRLSQTENDVGLRVRIVQVSAEAKGYRDHGLTFKITEKTALAAERWAIKAGNLLVSAGADVGKITGIASLSRSDKFKRFATAGFQALGGLDMDLTDSVLQDMLLGVEVVPEAGMRTNMGRKLNENDIRELPTLFMLRMEVIDLQMGFSETADPSTSTASGQGSAGSRTTQTSHPQSGLSFQPTHLSRL